MSKKSSFYKKLLNDGTVDPTPINQEDYDQVNRYIKDVFPKATRVQREIETTLKRTFILGKSEKTINKCQLSKAKSPYSPHTSAELSRKIRTKMEKKMPKILNYKDFIPLNALWKSYISDLLKDEKRPLEIQSRMNRADYHGALITVHYSNCDAYIGMTGIVLKETRNTFIVVTPANKTKTIPKPENVFNIELDDPEGTVRVAGNSFIVRPGERATKKVKGIMDFISQNVYKSRLTKKKNILLSQQ